MIIRIGFPQQRSVLHPETTPERLSPRIVASPTLRVGTPTVDRQNMSAPAVTGVDCGGDRVRVRSSPRTRRGRAPAAEPEGNG